MLCLLRINAAMLVGAVMLASLPGEAFPRSTETDLLQLESKIPLGNVRGRIDHMAVDVNRQRLYDVSLGDRVRLLSFLDEYGPAPLAACMSVIWNARDPVGALATLALRWFIDIEIDETLLGPDTIRIRQRHNIPSSTLSSRCSNGYLGSDSHGGQCERNQSKKFEKPWTVLAGSYPTA